MNTHSSLVAVAATLALAASATSALAQGYGYGSAGGVAATLGATASPPITQSGAPARAPVVVAPADRPLATGSMTDRDRAWAQVHRR